MIDTRAMGQELQDQVLAAARRGHQRVTSTVKTVTATAQLIRPQLPHVPSLPTLNLTALPLPAQLREKAPALIAKLPNADQLKAGAHEFAGQVRYVQRQVVGQVRSVATPLAQQAAAAFSQATTATAKAGPAKARPAAKAAAPAPAGEAPASETPPSETPAAQAPRQAEARQARPVKPARQARSAPRRTTTTAKKTRPAAK